MKKFKILHCPEADQEHRRNKRQYAHTGHYPGVICVAEAYYRLPYRFRMGLLLHELGHIYGAEGELEADKLATKMFGIPVKREDSPRYGEWLETI